jgi:hypothetical protein
MEKIFLIVGENPKAFHIGWLTGIIGFCLGYFLLGEVLLKIIF